MPLPSIKDSEILNQLKTTLEGIQTGAEYRNSFDKVYIDFSGGYAAVPARYEIVSNIKFVDDNQLDLISETVEDISMTVDIDLIVKRDDIILELKADTLKAIGTDITINGLAFDTKYEGSLRNKTDHIGNKISDMTITIKISYRRNSWSK